MTLSLHAFLAARTLRRTDFVAPEKSRRGERHVPQVPDGRHRPDWCGRPECTGRRQALQRPAAAENAGDHQAGDVQHAGGRPHPRGPAGLSARQSLEPDVSKWPLHPNSKNIIASIGADKPLPLQPRHGLHPRAARSEEGRRQDRRAIPTNRTRGRSRCPTTCPSKAGRLNYRRNSAHAQV